MYAIVKAITLPPNKRQQQQHKNPKQNEKPNKTKQKKLQKYTPPPHTHTHFRHLINTNAKYIKHLDIWKEGNVLFNDALNTF